MRRKVLAFLVSITLIMTMIPTQIFPHDIINLASINENVEGNITTSSGIVVNPYIGTGFEAEFNILNQWDNGFTGEIKITNTGITDIENWILAFNFEQEITSIWNAEITLHEENKYIIKNLEWNQDIAVGQSVTIGITGTYNGEVKLPTGYELLGIKQEVEEDGYKIEFKVLNNWEDAFTGEFVITNTSNKTIEDWCLEFDFDRNIQQFWTAEIIEHEGEHYVVKNKGYNANIAPGESIILGFMADPGEGDIEARNYTLVEAIEGIDYEKDTDNDGLTDRLEVILETNPNKKDTDEDGLDDYYEYLILDTNPCKKDTDENGVLDGDEDFDDDGLTNIQEYVQETEPWTEDTDSDGITDGDEINKYETKPVCDDTDGDGLLDGDDIALGFSPLLKDTDNNGILDSQERVEQIFKQKINNHKKPGIKSVAVDLKCAGRIENVIEITDMYNCDIKSSGVVGLIGVPVEINSEQSFEEATITFEYDESMLNGAKEEDLAIMWYDEENGIYRIFDKSSVIDTENNTVSYTTTHFSTYLLVDRQQWYNAWKNDIDYTRSETSKLFYDIGLIVDVSGSMGGSRLNNTKVGLKGFIENMYEGE